MQISRTRSFVVGLAVTVLSVSGVRAAEHDIYPDNPHEITAVQDALARAKSEHKRVILDFGGNWCPDCHVLDIYFHQAPNDKLLADNFVLVDVNIGRYDMNQDVVDKYGMNLKKGVPALAVLSPDGKVLHAQTTGEFEDMRHMQASSVTDFLNEWKPKK
jgi:thiol:disulfide interchange protein